MTCLEVRVVLDGDDYLPPGYGLVAVDIDTTVGAEVDIFHEISPNGDANGTIDGLQGDHGYLWETPFGEFIYSLQGFVEQSVYEYEKTVDEAKIDAWANRMNVLIHAEYAQQKSALTMLEAYFTTQNQASSFWGQFGAFSGIGAVAVPATFGYAAAVISAMSWVASYHVDDVVPNFTAYWGEALNKLTQMEALEVYNVNLNRTWMKLALMENLPSAVALTTDEVFYVFNNFDDGLMSPATITVDLEGRLDYYGPFTGLVQNFSYIEPLLNPYRPVHNVLAIYGDALVTFIGEENLTLGLGTTSYWDATNGNWFFRTEWISTEHEWVWTQWTFGSDDIAAELNSFDFMLTGFEVYLNIP